MKLNHKVSIKKPRVEIIPLIDAVFLILVFFLYTFLSMSVRQGLPVNLPQAASAIFDKKEHISVTITKENQIYLNKDFISLSVLADRLAVLFTENPRIRVYINGDEDAGHGTVVEALDVIRSSGIDKISIETKKKQGVS